ncbi:MAG: PEP-CTERM sorting domain-containing protein [Caldimonas sp.]
MSTRIVVAKILVATAMLASSVAAEAGFYGTGFATYYGFPDAGTPYPQASASPSTFTAGVGIETVFDVENVTTITVDFSDNSLSLLLNTTLMNPTWNNTSSNGPVFNVTAGGPLTFAGFSIDPATTMAGFTASRVGLSANQLTIDWAGLSYVDGTRVVVDFASPVPEPETYALMGLGLALVGVMSRSRRRGGRIASTSAS